MDEEKDILQYDMDILETEEIGEAATVSALEDTVSVEPLDSEATQTETMEYIIVEEPEEMTVDVDEAFVADNGIVMPEHTHAMSEIEKLEDTLDILGSTKDIYSLHSGIAEFRQWKDKNITSENRIGYFVSLINDVNDGNVYINICNTQIEDVYGVTVINSGFCGYQYGDYNVLNEQSNKANSNEPFEKVCLLGTVMVRFGGTQQDFDELKSGDYVIPNNKGCAVKSENKIGFKVVMKEAAGVGIDGWNKVMIALVPQNDNVARVMKEIEDTNKDLGDISIQLGDLNEKVDTNISISGDFEDLKDLVDQNTQNINQKLETIDKTLEEAEQISNDAKAAMKEMTTHYQEAMNQSDMAIGKAQEALGEINKHQDNLDILTQYGDNIAGFFAEASEDEVSIGTILRTQGDVSMLKQSSNAFQHLVCSVDIYSVGNQSPTEGLSFDEA
jgi:hypothetical protein